MANSVDPVQRPHSGVMILHCLHIPVCPNTWGHYASLKINYGEFMKLMNLKSKVAIVERSFYGKPHEKIPICSKVMPICLTHRPIFKHGLSFLLFDR